MQLELTNDEVLQVIFNHLEREYPSVVVIDGFIKNNVQDHPHAIRAKINITLTD